MKNKIVKVIPCVMSFVYCMVCCPSAKAQFAHTYTQGQIEFERTENTYYFLDNYFTTAEINDMAKYAESYKKTYPKFRVSKFTLKFDSQHSVYMPDKETASRVDFLSPFASANIVKTDFNKQLVVSNKSILGIDYHITDSVKKVQWKFTGETREIAGFLCRRANALILDSIYVVAFYTDQILPKGGPESFNGLPGMILGLSLPHEHISWFAKSFSAETTFESSYDKPLKGKDIGYSGLDSIIVADKTLKSPATLLKFARKRVKL